MPQAAARFIIAALLLTALTSAAQAPQLNWPIHSDDRPMPAEVTPGKLPGSAPSDAIILFDGTSSKAFESVNGGPALWKVHDGVLEVAPGTGNIRTVQPFGDVQLHVEFAEPNPPTTEGEAQNRGNSGIIFMGLYELQVLDSFHSKSYADGIVGSVYGQYPPLVSAAREPGQWQTYDIVFRHPGFRGDGSLHNPAEITAFLNGVLVQDGTHPTGPTGHLERPPYVNMGDKLPLVLQEHNGAVQYRNIWIRPLPAAVIPMPPQGIAELKLTRDTAASYIGAYGSANNNYQFVATDKGLALHIHRGGPKAKADDVWVLHMTDRDTFVGVKTDGQIPMTLEFSRGPKDTLPSVIVHQGGRYNILPRLPDAAAPPQ